MTITYTIPQCKLEVEAYLKQASQFLKAKTGTTSEWEQVYRYNLLRWQRRLAAATERKQLEDKYTFHLGRALLYRGYYNASRRASPPPKSLKQTFDERQRIDLGSATWHLRQARELREQLKAL